MERYFKKILSSFCWFCMDKRNAILDMRWDMKRIAKKFLLWMLCVLAISAEYLIIQYPLFELHGMGEWPFDVMIFGAAVISVAACFDLKRLMISASVGYFPSFFAGRAVGSRMLVNSHDGLPTDTVWIWFAVFFLVAILLGIVFEVLKKARRRLNEKNNDLDRSKSVSGIY